MQLGDRIRLVYRMLHPAAFNDRPAIPWFRRLLERDGTEVSESTIYRWVDDGCASEDKALAVDTLILTLATKAQNERQAEIAKLDEVK